MTKFISALFILIIACSSCNSHSQELEQIKLISQKTIDLDYNFGETYKIEILKNSRLNPALYGHLMERVNEFDSLFDSALLDIGKLNSNDSKKERELIIRRIHQTILTVAEKCKIQHLKLEIDSLNQYDYLNNDLLKIKTEMQLVNLRTEIFRNLYLNSTTFGFILSKRVQTGDLEISNQQVNLSLESLLFSNFPFNKVTLDSSFFNGHKISLNPEFQSKQTFSKLKLDSLKSGNYQIYGNVVNYQKGIEYKGEFSKEFTIPPHNDSQNNP